MAQEGLHNIKTKKVKVAILKIDLSKAYDKVSWLYIGMLLTHLGFCIGFIRWIMSCVTTVSFAVLMNGAALPLFHAKRGYDKVSRCILYFSYWWLRDSARLLGRQTIRG